MQIRKVVLANAPFCEICNTRPSTEVDHIQRLADGGINHPDNYQALCHDCHANKTAHENHWQDKVEIGEDGYPLG